MTKQERYDEIMKSWAKHAPIPYQWPHDEPWERWFPEIIRLVFGRIRCLERLVDLPDGNNKVTAPPDLD